MDIHLTNIKWDAANDLFTVRARVVDRDDLGNIQAVHEKQLVLNGEDFAALDQLVRQVKPGIQAELQHG